MNSKFFELREERVLTVESHSFSKLSLCNVFTEISRARDSSGRHSGSRDTLWRDFESCPSILFDCERKDTSFNLDRRDIELRHFGEKIPACPAKVCGVMFLKRTEHASADKMECVASGKHIRSLPQDSDWRETDRVE